MKRKYVSIRCIARALGNGRPTTTVEMALFKLAYGRYPRRPHKWEKREVDLIFDCLPPIKRRAK